MQETSQALGFRVELALPYADAIARVTEGLKLEGFGVLTEIDVRATLKKKLDVDFRPYIILGACNPALAHRALSAAPEVGLLLPCNVTVSETDAAHSLVHLVDPLAMLSVVEGAELRAIADEARAKLQRVAHWLQEEID
jgi:uncharacterized protein (DUF302 family)